jgi:hypothetical protein
MASKPPDSVYLEKHGTNLLRRAVWSSTNLDDADTWASGITTGYVDHWFSPKNDPTTQASTGMHVAYSAGTFTFYPGEDNCTGTLFVLTR